MMHPDPDVDVPAYQMNDPTTMNAAGNCVSQAYTASIGEESYYHGNSPLALDPDAHAHHSGEVGQYFHVNNAGHNEGKDEFNLENCSEFATSNSHDVSSSMEQDEHCADEESEEGLLFEDNSYVDEITRWMDDQRPLQPQTQLLTDGHEQHEGTSSTDSEILPEQSNVYVRDCSTGNFCASKRNASQMSDTISAQKISAKRRNRSLSASQSASPDNRSASRIRMDNALQERSQSQMALRDGLFALERVKAVVRECRSRYDTAKILVENTAKEECESLLQEDVSWNEMFHKLKEYKEENGDCNVKQNVSRDDAGDENNSSEMIRRLSAWVGKNRKEYKQRRSTFRLTKKAHEGKSSEECKNAHASSMAVSPDESDFGMLQNFYDDDNDDDDVFDDVDPDSIHADPYKRVALDSINFDWDPRNSRWNNMYEELRRYKEEHGSTLVPHANFGLGAWVKRQQVQYTLYSKNDGTKSDLTEERVRLLNDLGFVWSRRTNTWNENFLRLVKWKETHGSCHVPDDSKDPDLVTLHKWVADQRVNYKRQIIEDGGTASDDPSAMEGKEFEERESGSDGASKKRSKRKPPKLSQDKIAMLKGIGFEFDSRDAKWLSKLELLMKYKESQGDFLVPSSYPEDPTLSNWVASQRAQYKLYMKGKRSNMTERRLRVLTDAEFPFSVNESRQKVKKEAAHQDRVVFDAKPWIEKFKDFLLFIAANDHGNLESLQKANPYLAEWAATLGEASTTMDDATDVVRDNDGILSSSELYDHNALINAAKFFVFCQINKSDILHLHDKSIEPSSVTKEESTSWDDQFGNVAAWYIKHGSYAPKGMPTKLKKFVSRQQEQHRLFTSGLDSELTSERIEKLEGICFPVDKAASKELRDDDTTSSRRNRSWEEFRLDLAIMYIQKGNYDANSFDDVELRRWAAEQKRQHKLYLGGKQSTLSIGQIQKLMEIKFVSKRPKQRLWSENVADLLAFRIQFGTFDVLSAQFVPNSKGKYLNPCANATALKNLQEWVTKVRGYYSESSKSVETNEDFTQDQKSKLDSVGFPWDGCWVSSEELILEEQYVPKEQENTGSSTAEDGSAPVSAHD